MKQNKSRYEDSFFLNSASKLSRNWNSVSNDHLVKWMNKTDTNKHSILPITGNESKTFNIYTRLYNLSSDII